MKLMHQADLQIRTIWALSFIVVKTAMVAKTTMAKRTEARVDLMKLGTDQVPPDQSVRPSSHHCANASKFPCVDATACRCSPAFGEPLTARKIKAL